VDGGSTDGSVEVLRSYGARFTWVSEPDGGQTAAINKGLSRARGEVLAYLNSDDVLYPDAVARVVAHFAANPDCDLVYGRAHYITSTRRA
jgi:glycosyltransferase involved in cell wall biosynthesis